MTGGKKKKIERVRFEVINKITVTSKVGLRQIKMRVTSCRWGEEGGEG